MSLIFVRHIGDLASVQVSGSYICPHVCALASVHISVSLCLSKCLCSCLSMCLCSLSVHVSVFVFVHLTVFLCLCSCISPHVCVSVHISLLLCLSTCLCSCVCPGICFVPLNLFSSVCVLLLHSCRTGTPLLSLQCPLFLFHCFKVSKFICPSGNIFSSSPSATSLSNPLTLSSHRSNFIFSVFVFLCALERRLFHLFLILFYFFSLHIYRLSIKHSLQTHINTRKLTQCTQNTHKRHTQQKHTNKHIQMHMHFNTLTFKVNVVSVYQKYV